MADLSASQIKALESLRSRLLALKGSMQAMQADLHNPQQPLPSWASLQRQARLLLDGIQEIVVQTRDNEQLFKSTVAFPTPDFPAPTSDNILQALIRTKLDPSVEEWVNEGEKFANKVNQAGVLSEEDCRELWASAAEIYSSNGSKYPWGADYTRDEVDTGVEHVVTGLRRELVEPVLEPDDDLEDDEDEGEEEQEQDTKMDVEKPTAPAAPAPFQPPIPVDKTLKFLATGGAG